MNARFTFNDCKFTLSPGQLLSHYKSEPTDEGYSFEGFTLDYDGTDVTADICTGGRDCDGPIERYYELILTKDGWKELSAYQRDHYAEMMGY